MSQIPKVSAMVEDNYGWAGWSNSRGSNHLESLEDGFYKVKDQIARYDDVLNWAVIDVDNQKAWVSSPEVTERTIRSAKVNFGADIPLENITVGFPS